MPVVFIFVRTNDLSTHCNEICSTIVVVICVVLVFTGFEIKEIREFTVMVGNLYNTIHLSALNPPAIYIEYRFNLPISVWGSSLNSVGSIELPTCSDVEEHL